MAIFHPPVRVRRFFARHLFGVVVVLAWTASAAEAQDRRYLLEVGAAGAAHSFDGATDLGAAAGGLLRAGIWLPWNFSVEGELNFSSPTAETADEKVGVRTLSAAALFNIPIGAARSLYLKGGAGTTSYGGDCPAVSTPGSAICGTSGALLLGGGFRLGLTPSLMVRGEGLYNRNRSNAVSLSNYSANLGLSLMLGSRPLPDNDRDGIPNRDDRCPGTSQGSRVDRTGCTIDGDGDGIADGVDRCPNTPVGATTDALGCPKDSDNDNILDGLDRCPDTRAGVLVDPEGCPRDTDEDGIPDGLDRCSATPKGATVDALGCPGDEDADGILDGLDQCPRSPVGDVDPRGCASGQTPRRPLQVPDSAPTPAPAPEPSPTPARNPTPAQPPEPASQPASRPTPARRPAGTIGTTASVLPHVGFFTGTARLRQTSYGTLDSVAAILLADSTLRVEIGAHSDEIKSPAETERLTNLQAEAVRTFLIRKGVHARQMIARGYGARVPLTPDTTPRGLARNRRIEIRRIAPAP